MDTKIITNLHHAGFLGKMMIILKSDLGFNPSNDGKIIRIIIPQLTKESRKQIVKIVHKRAEEAKVSTRNNRREANEKLKKLEKEKHIWSCQHCHDLDACEDMFLGKSTDPQTFCPNINELKRIKES